MRSPLSVPTVCSAGARSVADRPRIIVTSSFARSSGPSSGRAAASGSDRNPLDSGGLSQAMPGSRPISVTCASQPCRRSAWMVRTPASEAPTTTMRTWSLRADGPLGAAVHAQLRRVLQVRRDRVDDDDGMPVLWGQLEHVGRAHVTDAVPLADVQVDLDSHVTPLSAGTLGRTRVVTRLTCVRCGWTARSDSLQEGRVGHPAALAHGLQSVARSR